MAIYLPVESVIGGRVINHFYLFDIDRLFCDMSTKEGTFISSTGLWSKNGNMPWVTFPLSSLVDKMGNTKKPLENSH